MAKTITFDLRKKHVEGWDPLYIMEKMAVSYEQNNSNCLVCSSTGESGDGGTGDISVIPFEELEYLKIYDQLEDGSYDQGLLVQAKGKSLDIFDIVFMGALIPWCFENGVDLEILY